jgi:hypothetical protein
MVDADSREFACVGRGARPLLADGSVGQHDFRHGPGRRRHRQPEGRAVPAPGRLNAAIGRIVHGLGLRQPPTGSRLGPEVRGRVHGESSVISLVPVPNVAHLAPTGTMGSGTPTDAETHLRCFYAFRMQQRGYRNGAVTTSWQCRLSDSALLPPHPPGWGRFAGATRWHRCSPASAGLLRAGGRPVSNGCVNPWL